MNNSFSSLIEKATSVLILISKNPSVDEVAASLSLYLALRDGKDISISCPSPMTVAFNRFVGVNKVSTELGNKNLTIGLTGYNPENIEKVSADVVGDTFTMTVIPKSGNEPPAKTQLAIGYSGVNANLVILIGGKTSQDFPALTSEELSSVELAHIGVNDITIEKRQVSSFAKPASSISEIVGELVMTGDRELSDDISSNLLTGLQEGSRNFTVQGVTAASFEMAAKLMNAGGKRIDAQPMMQRQYPVGAIPGEKLEKPQGESTNAPQSWMQQPKIYKGTSVN